MAPDFEAIVKDTLEETASDDPAQEIILFQPHLKYLVVDESGYVARIFSNESTPNNGSASRHKYD
jgi:hypothetical protein